MKLLSTLVGSLTLAVLVVASAASAAPVESVESGRAATARQTVDEFLCEQVVVQQLTALGVSQEEACTRLASLSEPELEQLAADIQTVRAGGTIEGSSPHPFGIVGCIFRPFAELIHAIISTFVCWTK